MKKKVISLIQSASQPVEEIVSKLLERIQGIEKQNGRAGSLGKSHSPEYHNPELYHPQAMSPGEVSVKTRSRRMAPFDGEEIAIDPSAEFSVATGSSRMRIEYPTNPFQISAVSKEESCYISSSELYHAKSAEESSNSKTGLLDNSQQQKLSWEKPHLHELTDCQFLTIDKFRLGGSGEYWAGCRGSKLVRIDSQGVRIHESIAGESNESIVEVVALSRRVCLVRNKFIVDIVHYSGDFEFQLSLKAYFDDDDEYITSCLGHKTRDYLLLATNVGMLLVVKIDFEEKSANVLHFEREHTKRISAVLWLDEAANIFVTASNDKHICKFKINGEEGCQQLARFGYDQPIMKCCVSHDFLIVAFAPGWVSVVETQRGTPLASMGDDQCKIRKLRLENARVNWIGCVYTVGRIEALELSKKALENKNDFLRYLSHTRVMVKSDDPVLHIIAYPKAHPDNRSVVMFRDPIFASNKYNPRIPVMIEQIGPSRLAVRAFAGTYHDPKSDKMWMSQCFVTVKPTKQQPSTIASKSGLSQNLDA